MSVEEDEVEEDQEEFDFFEENVSFSMPKTEKPIKKKQQKKLLEKL